MHTLGAGRWRPTICLGDERLMSLRYIAVSITGRHKETIAPETRSVVARAVTLLHGAKQAPEGEHRPRDSR